MIKGEKKMGKESKNCVDDNNKNENHSIYINLNPDFIRNRLEL